VHFKRGKDNSLVWVTSLDAGKPVADAEVHVSDCKGNELWRGRTDASGRASSLKTLPESSCDDDSSFYFASARLGEDYSFVRSDWNEGIEPWRFGVQTWGEGGLRRMHTVFDRTLLRPGQTVSMKHISRDRNSRGFAFPNSKTLPKEMVIRHEGSNDEFRQPLVWDSRGVAINQWKIPESAKLGNYSVSLSDGKEGSEETGSFRVSDFRLPVFTGSVQGVPPRQVAAQEVPLALGLSYLNGGAAKGAKVQVSATLRSRWMAPLPEFKGFSFDVDFEQEGLAAFAIEGKSDSEQLVADKQPVTLDQAGAGKLAVKLPVPVKAPSELHAEMTFADPNGEIQTIRGAVELWPAELQVGIRVKEWLRPNNKGSVEVAAVDTKGKALADIAVRVIAKRRIDFSHRKRIVGGFYAYENTTEFKDLGEICSGRTDSRGILPCSPQVSEPGAVYLVAEARDSKGNMARAGTSYWISGHGDNWFAADNQDRIDVIPEKKVYAPGEIARLQVRTPFREATALISIEAEGIIDTMVVPLSRFKPVIEFPVKAEWGPNVFVSVLVVRGRVEPLKWTSFFSWGWREPSAWFKEWWNPTQPSAMVDLAKPAFKLGLAGIDVGTQGFQLKVEVKPEKADYRPRDKANVKVTVITPDGKPAPAGTEIAFAAVDQALLELKPNESWKLLEAMLNHRAYQVETATAQSQVIGKRHYGKKAVPAGGGGGKAPARELFDTLLLWNPKVVLDATGSATIQVPINDSLTEFKLIAIADAGTSLFGTGSASIRTKQDLQLISGLPPLVRENDRFTAMLTLRNGTAKPMELTVTAKAGDQPFTSREIRLEPESAAEMVWPAEVKEGITSLVWEFEAIDKNSKARDLLKITQKVGPAVPVTVQQATFARVDKTLEIPAIQPPGSLPGRGGIEIGLSPKISTPPPGLKHFFEEYPFVCLEQKTSVAIGLKDEKRWQLIIESLPTYLDSSGLAAYFPSGTGSPALTAYVLSASHAAGFAIPDNIAQRMERGLAAFAEGRTKPEHWAPVNDLVARKLTALEALTRRGGKPLSAISSLEVDPFKLPTSALIDWYLIAKRLPELPNRAGRLAAADRELRNRLSYLGGKLVFTSERSDYWWWLMASGDANSFRLLEAMLDEPSWREDLPALVQGAMQRQVRGRWSTTVANVWATIALNRFGQKFEKESVSGSTRAKLGASFGSNLAANPPQEYNWRNWKDGEAAKLMLPWPAKPEAEDKLQIGHEGSGRPWAAMQVMAALPIKEARAFGFKVNRSVTPVEEKLTGKVSRGDVWRVRLDIQSDQEMTWVVVSDPIPAGARILGEGDGRDSSIARNVKGGAEQGSGNAWPAYVERSFSAFRAYYSYVPRGNFSVEYTVRLNNGGAFSMPATRVEAMYAPEVFGEVPNAKVEVRD
ncbi:MAG: large extracellular alpha-helical protein, partial [Proteobacteria bacterium]|nr:large extracellular alpha-helical protein [Pseudomonadota bacterium]